MKARRALSVSLVAVLCLLLGAATTVGVAWWIALNAGHGTLVREIWCIGATYEWPGSVPPSWPAPHRVTWEQAWGTEYQTGYAYHRPDLVRVADPPLAPDRYYSQVRRHGWPVAALDCERARGSGLTGKPLPQTPAWIFASWRAGIWWKTSGVGREGRLIQLPCRPLWLGLALDSGVYAGMWGVFLLSTILLHGAARRRLRVSRGLCTACGYNLAGSPGGACPECGAGGSIA
jgi:hypothetical protein